MAKSDAPRSGLENFLPGQISAEGFLGSDRRSPEEIVRADEAEMAALGVTSRSTSSPPTTSCRGGAATSGWSRESSRTCWGCRRSCSRLHCLRMSTLRRVQAAFPQGTRLFFRNEGAETQEKGGGSGSGENPEQQARESGRERKERIKHQPPPGDSQTDPGYEDGQGPKRSFPASFSQKRPGQQETCNQADDDPGHGRSLAQARDHPA
jgi:hypothetical protein